MRVQIPHSLSRVVVPKAGTHLHNYLCAVPRKAVGYLLWAHLTRLAQIHLPAWTTMYAATGLVRSIPALQCKSTGLGIRSKAAKTFLSKTLPWLDRKLFGLSTIGITQ